MLTCYIIQHQTAFHPTVTRKEVWYIISSKSSPNITHPEQITVWFTFQGCET